MRAIINTGSRSSQHTALDCRALSDVIVLRNADVSSCSFSKGAWACDRHSRSKVIPPKYSI